MRGSRTGKPLMALLDLLGRRWALRMLWELRDKELNFRALQAACDQMSTSVLNVRIAEAREVGLVQQVDSGYRLTKQGAELLRTLTGLDAWAKAWAATLSAVVRGGS